MTDLVKALFRVDPTEGLVQFVTATKPFHTKVLDVLVEYVYKENVTVNVKDKWKWVIHMSNPGWNLTHAFDPLTGTRHQTTDVVRSCGYGLTWDPVNTPETNPVLNIISGHSATDVPNKVYSFLVQPNYGAFYNIAVIDTQSNQLAFVDTFSISAVTPASKKWKLSTDIRPTHTITSTALDELSLGNVAGNCSFMITGNHEHHFPPGSTFVVTGGSNAGTYTVVTADMNRLYPRFDGYNTIIPVNEVISSSAPGGTITIDINVILPSGQEFFIQENSGNGGNGRYTVNTVSTVTGTTEIICNETLSTMTASDGKIHIPIHAIRIPAWPHGLCVEFDCTGLYPAPMNHLSKFFYIPTSTPGRFNLSTKRYPTEFEDYVDFSTTHTGFLTTRKAEQFHPGAYITVSGTHLNRNDKNYTVKRVVKEGANVRVYVMEKVPFTTPTGLLTDGKMVGVFDSFDAPVYCSISQAPDLYADTFIHESIDFAWNIQLTEDVMTSMVAPIGLGWGAMGFGGIEPFNDNVTVPTGRTADQGTGTILPHGIDVQLFGIGGLVEYKDFVPPKLI